MNDVLAGVDPRDLSIPALIWAADETARRGLRLRLVAAVPPVHDGAKERPAVRPPPVPTER